MNDKQEGREFTVSRVRIRKLWGYRDIELLFNPETNILIGRNATGKTSIINILRSLLTLDVASLIDVTFEEVVVTLSAVDKTEQHLLKAVITKDTVTITLDSERMEMPLPPSMLDQAMATMPELIERDRWNRRRHLYGMRNSSIRQKLQMMVPSVWLPVNRGVSIHDDENGYGHERRKSPGVEERLEVLLQELQTYRLTLEARLAATYKEFEKRVLELILFNKSYDNFSSLKLESNSSEVERQQLANAFREAGLLDRRMQTRIDEHFLAQSEAQQRMQKQSIGAKSTGAALKQEFELSDIFIMPLIRRTKEMLRHARDLEQEKQHIFAGLSKYTEIVSSFLMDKSVEVSEKGQLKILFSNPKAREQRLTHQHLSSGEKQIIILLTQALIFEGKPVVYMADEPELSLHVRWQEKLLESLRALNPKMQLIIATHSPDIVGGRSVIDLELFLR